MQFARARKKRLPIFDASKKAARKLRLGWRVYLLGAFFILLSIGLAYLLFWSPFLKIKEITIVGDNFNDQSKVESIVRDILNKRIWYYVPGDSFFVVSTQTIKEKIEKTFPEAENISVISSLSGDLRVFLTGRQAAAIWCQGEKQAGNSSSSPAIISSLALTENSSTTLPEKVTLWQKPEVTRCFFVDKNSFVFREAPEISGTILPTFYDQTEREVAPGTVVSASSTIEFAALIQSAMKEREINFQGFLINNINNPDLIALTSEGWQIYFDLNRSVWAPLKVLDALLKGELSEKRAFLKYIDLRTANRVYYQ